MKETIAEAAQRLMQRKGNKKLTVKDIVEECHITRQAFYYHFEDIPDLLGWMLEKKSEQFLAEALAQEKPQEQLKYFLTIAVNARPMMEKGMQAGYGTEMGKRLRKLFDSVLEQIIEKNHLYENYKRQDLKLVIRYHGSGIMGVLLDIKPDEVDHAAQVLWELLNVMPQS